MGPFVKDVENALTIAFYILRSATFSTQGCPISHGFIYEHIDRGLWSYYHCKLEFGMPSHLESLPQAVCLAKKNILQWDFLQDVLLKAILAVS
jgi:hypothetical protein